jgi:hypothetical protein
MLVTIKYSILSCRDLESVAFQYKIPVGLGIQPLGKLTGSRIEVWG